MPPRAKPTPARIKVATKERFGLELRKAGLTFEAIAQMVGYSDRSAAAKAIRRALADTIQEPADELRRLELERCDALHVAVWPEAMAGDAEAIRACLRIMVRRAELLGLDAPARSRVEVITHDAFAQAMAELEAEIAELETGDRSQSG